MQVYKFGGASIKDSRAINNIASIIDNGKKSTLVIVVSAMGKITNLLEKVTQAFIGKHPDLQLYMHELKQYHLTIINELFANNTNTEVYRLFEHEFDHLNNVLDNEPSLNYNFDYDQIVHFGEIFSSIIISCYLNYKGYHNKLINIKKVLITDSNFRDAKINFEVSQNLARNTFLLEPDMIYVTQGFIGADINNLPTTLGREGSDYSAAALAYLLNINELTIWKDVDGIYNADPKKFDKATLLPKISYREAIELAYFGAKVIHPKTIQPIQNKNIKLYVKSFYHPNLPGTVITNENEASKPEVPIYILKENQILISIWPKDFSFVAEENLGHIFSLMAKFRIQANLIQNSAINFSICCDNSSDKIPAFTTAVKQTYNMLYNSNLELLTIRHYTAESIDLFTSGKKLFIQQLSRSTARFVMSVNI